MISINPIIKKFILFKNKIIIIGKYLLINIKIFLIFLFIDILIKIIQINNLSLKY